MKTENVDHLLKHFEDAIVAEFKLTRESKKERILPAVVRKKSFGLLWGYMEELRHGSDEEKLFRKLLKLELAYKREDEKERLRKLIHEKTGMIVSGTYSLQEIGDVFDITRERVRQIELEAKRRLETNSSMMLK